MVKDAEQMTPKELRDLADYKESKIGHVKTGILKFDLYTFFGNQPNGSWICYPDEWAYFGEEEKQRLVKDFESYFGLLLKKGTIFYCNIEDGEELWYENSEHITDYSSKWAEEHLEDIKDIKDI